MSHSLILYQRITGDFYTIISEGKFTLSYILSTFAKTRNL